MKKIISFTIASWFGAGYLPISGTATSLIALPVVFATAYFFGMAGIIVLSAITYIAGVISVREVLRYTTHDPKVVVIDEVAGQAISFVLIANTLQNNLSDLWIYAVGFGLFRIFDITKPLLAGYFDRKVLNAHGVMLDDVAAGAYSAIILWIIIQLI